VYYDVRDLKPGNVTTLPTSTWLYSFPRGQQQKATEQRIAPDFDWLLAPDAGGHFLGDYDGIAADGVDGVRPVFSATINAPQTNEYSGVFQTPSGDPFGSAAPSFTPQSSLSPADAAARAKQHTLARTTSH
jgi:hypothetical protein